MDRLRAALSWSGTSATVSLFVVTPRGPAPEFELAVLPANPRLESFDLDDDAGVLGGLHMYEYDLVWSDLPSDLEGAIQASLEWALRTGALLAWCAFEGSFDFDYLLHPDVAEQVYGVAAGEAIRLALDDDFRSSEQWKRLLLDLRQLLP